jgi:uncharacterized membrane protein YqjE
MLEGARMEDPSVGIAAMMIMTLVFVLVGVVATVGLVVVPFWVICRKAGFAGPLALLMLVPIANVILPFYLAFARWPALQARDDQPMRQS